MSSLLKSEKEVITEGGAHEHVRKLREYLEGEKDYNAKATFFEWQVPQLSPPEEWADDVKKIADLYGFVIFQSPTSDIIWEFRRGSEINPPPDLFSRENRIRYPLGFPHPVEFIYVSNPPKTSYESYQYRPYHPVEYVELGTSTPEKSGRREGSTTETPRPNPNPPSKSRWSKIILKSSY